MTQTEQIDWTDALARFGLSSFRTGQREVISAVLAGKDCLCIMPTGGGKSLCYQLPSVIRDGVTLVISPLIALMKDQVDSLLAQNIKATFINSSLDSQEQRLRLSKMSEGYYDLVYIAPERLRSPQFQSAVRATHVQLLAVDEAHCISEWGHDFRPDYARIGRFRQRLGNPQTIALTATATETVREDIRQQLEFHDATTFITGFARENLAFQVWHPNTFREKQQALLDFIESIPGCGIVYASTRKMCEELVDLLRENIKRRVGFYHAGLMPDERRQIQEEFMSGEIPIIVATNAFGMGIDKSDLRFVVHYNLPGTLEAYYQEAGRAGRDGKPSRCLLLFSYADRKIQEFFIENAYPPPEVVKLVYEFLREREEDPIELTLQETKEELGVSISPEGIGVCEQLLHKCGAIERLDSQQNMASVRINSQLPTLVDLLPKDAKTRRRVLREIEREVGDMRDERVYFHPRHIADRLDVKLDAVVRALRELNRLEQFDYVSPFRGKAVHVVDRSVPFEKLKIDFDELKARRKSEYDKLDAVVQYAYGQRCRQLIILEYFGDNNRAACGNCDCCGMHGATAGVGKPAVSVQSPAVRVIERQSADDALVHVVRIALSGAARTHGRIGKTLIGQMLCGSTDKKLKKFGLQRLSTFGLLNRLSQREVVQILDALMQARLLQQVEAQKYRPLTEITDLGRQVMTGERKLDMPLPLSLALSTKITQLYAHEARRAAGQEKSGRQSSSSVRDETAVSDAQAGKSAEVARGGDVQGEQPVEFGERGDAEVDLESLSWSPDVEMPATARVDQSGNEWLDANALLQQTSELVDDMLANDAEAVLDSGSQSCEEDEVLNVEKHSEAYWTWLLFCDGYSAAQVCTLRRLESAQVIEHLTAAAKEGMSVEPNWMISPPNLALLDRYVQSLRAEHADLPPPEPPWMVPRNQFELYLCIMSNSR